MKKRHSAEQVVEKLREADVELGKGARVSGRFGQSLESLKRQVQNLKDPKAPQAQKDWDSLRYV